MSLILNGQPKRRLTVRMLEFCHACLGALEPFAHTRIPNFTASFGKNDVGLEIL